MTNTLIPGPVGTYVPFLFVEEHARRVRLEKRQTFGHYRARYSAFYTDDAGVEVWIGTIESFSDGSGFSVSSSVLKETGQKWSTRSTTTRTRKGAVQFLVATAAGMRWHS